MDFTLLASVLGGTEIHTKFWDVYEEYGSERWAEELESLDYSHYTAVSEGGVSQTIVQSFDRDTNNFIEWTLAFELEPEQAHIICRCRYMYQDWPHCLAWPPFYECEVSDIAELPAALEEASAALLDNLFTLRREKRCRIVWQAAQDEANARLQEHHDRVGFVPPTFPNSQDLHSRSKHMKDAFIVSAVRTPVGRGLKGTLRNTRPDDLAALVLQEAVSRAGIEASEVEDVYLGCAIPEAEQGLNVARLAALRAGMPDSVGGVTVNRFCSSGLQTIAMAAAAIQTGQADVMLAGGVESMSMVPMSGHNPSPNPDLVDTRPGAYIGMGMTAENVAEKYGISREDQDKFALASHQKAKAARDAGKFRDEIVPVPVQVDTVKGTKVKSQTVQFDTDELIRDDASLEAMGKLKSAFKMGGSVTPANSSPFSDGAAAVVVMSGEKVQELGVKPLARFLGFAVAGVDPELMGIGPVAAIPKVLKQTGLSLADIDLIELNEAFAAQSLAVVRELGLDESKLNVNGGAIALGHPLGCTGAKLTTSAIYELQRRGGGKALITMCIGGGMGAAGIIEVFAAEG